MLPKINFKTIFYQFWSVLGGFGERLGKLLGMFAGSLKGFGESLARVWEGLRRFGGESGSESRFEGFGLVSALFSAPK